MIYIFYILTKNDGLKSTNDSSPISFVWFKRFFLTPSMTNDQCNDSSEDEASGHFIRCRFENHHYSSTASLSTMSSHNLHRHSQDCVFNISSFWLNFQTQHFNPNPTSGFAFLEQKALPFDPNRSN